MKKLLRILTAPFRFLIALDRNEIALNPDDREYLKHKRSQRGEAEFAVFMMVCAIIVGLIAFSMWALPHYSVYKQRKYGEAQLAHAQSSKEVAVAEAKAKMESATMLAQAEVERAKGVAEANRIIGESLKNNESYLRYLWISGLESNNPTVIYVPTEANLPILEASRTPRANVIAPKLED